MIRKVWIKHFRNINEVTLNLENTRHCYLFGHNNQGKTSVLHAIYLACKQELPDSIDTVSAVSYDAHETIIGIDVEEEEKKRIYFRCNKDTKKESRVNEKREYKTQSSKRPIMYLSADALHLFQKDPGFRRQQLDRWCVYFYPEYAAHLKNYERTIRQKNKYLKQEQCDIRFIQTLNMQLVQDAAPIIYFRQKALETITLHLKSWVSDMPNIPQIDSVEYQVKRLEYNEDSMYKDVLMSTLANDIEKEKIVGYTLSGPHRDDFEILIDGRNSYDYFSRGINRSLSVLMQAAFLDLSRLKGQDSCLLCDDTFAEIDAKNKRALIEKLQSCFQIIYATLDVSAFSFFSDSLLVSIDGGVLRNERFTAVT